MTIRDEQLSRFRDEGFLRLGRLLNNIELAAIGARINQIMMGTANVPYDRMLMQLEPSTKPPENLSGQTKGYKRATLGYRKVQDLELDPLFFSYLTRPMFADLCRKVYGEGRPIACMRAMFMNKPAGGGSDLEWHQDRWTTLDRDPQITVWTALDQTSIANGCVEIVPRSHHRLQNPSANGGFLSIAQLDGLNRRIKSDDPWCRSVHLELEAGEAVLLHNWTLHRSGTNATEMPRRAFSVCYMDGFTRSLQGLAYSLIFDDHGRTVSQIV